MTIELYGLTEKEKALCDIMWSIETSEGINSFISSLPKQDQDLCESLMDLIILAGIDEVENTDLANEVIANIKQKL